MTTDDVKQLLFWAHLTLRERFERGTNGIICFNCLVILIYIDKGASKYSEVDRADVDRGRGCRLVRVVLVLLLVCLYVAVVHFTNRAEYWFVW